MDADSTSEEETVTFYAGAAEIELYRTETENYRDNLVLGRALTYWVALLSTAGDPPYQIAAVTADPAEGEALTEPGQGIVEAVPMPVSVRDTIASFIAEYHVKQISRSASAIVRIQKRWHGVARNIGAAMSNDADFLARWSRRKHDAATDKIKQAKQIETSTSATSETDPASLSRRKIYCHSTPRVYLQ